MSEACRARPSPGPRVTNADAIAYQPLWRRAADGAAASGVSRRSARACEYLAGRRLSHCPAVVLCQPPPPTKDRRSLDVRQSPRGVNTSWRCRFAAIAIVWWPAKFATQRFWLSEGWRRSAGKPGTNSRHMCQLTCKLIPTCSEESTTCNCNAPKESPHDHHHARNVA